MSNYKIKAEILFEQIDSCGFADCYYNKLIIKHEVNRELIINDGYLKYDNYYEASFLSNNKEEIHYASK